VKSKSSAMKCVYVDLNDFERHGERWSQWKETNTDVAMSHLGDPLSVTSVQ